jgi:acetyl-CoA synthetase
MGFEGLLWAVMPAWHHGVPVIASPHPFDPERALALLADHGVRTIIMPPDHLAALTGAALIQSHTLPRAIATGPDPLPKALHEAVDRAFGIIANEIWGTCRVGAVAANNSAIMEMRLRSPGKAVPGVFVEAVDYDGSKLLGAGHAGILAVAPDTPGACLSVWGDSQTALRASNGWILSGWSGSRDLDGYIWPDPRPGLDLPIPVLPDKSQPEQPAFKLDGVSPQDRW